MNEKHSNSLAGEVHRVHEKPKRYLIPTLIFVEKGKFILGMNSITFRFFTKEEFGFGASLKM